MDEKKIERMMQMADRIVANLEMGAPQFPSSDYDFSGENVVYCLVEGQLRGKTFASWLPVRKELLLDEDYKAQMRERATQVWRVYARSELVPMPLLIGPKGILPK